MHTRQGIGLEILCPKSATWLYDRGLEVLMELFHQLSPYHDKSFSQADVVQLVNESAVLLIAVDLQKNGHMVGIARLVVEKRANQNRCGILHDVVVDTAYRRLGIGTALIQKLISLACRFHLDTLEFTAKPQRNAIHQLGQRLEFNLVAPANPADPNDTNQYQLKLF